MADVQIDTTARIERVRLQNQTGTFAGDPDAGYSWLYVGESGTVSGGLYLEKETGEIFGPFVAEIDGVATIPGRLSVLGGVHVGGISDPGEDNLIVDGTSTLTGITSTAEIRADLIQISNSGSQVTASAALAATITVSKSHHRVAGYDGNPSEIQTIAGGVEGDILVLQSLATDVDITLKDSVDNMEMFGDSILSHRQDTIMFIYAGGGWMELSRSNNA